MKLTFKSLKPAQAYTLSVSLADTIAAIKSQLANEAGAPPADVQRLLLKGKALADGKLLKEYDVKDGDTLNLMVKPGYQWDPSKVTPSATTETPAGAVAEELKPITLLPEPTRHTRGHGRIPSVVLSPSPSLTAVTDEKVVDIPLVLDTSNIPSSPTGGPESTFHTTISQPEFWEHLYTFLRYVILHYFPAWGSWDLWSRPFLIFFILISVMKLINVSSWPLSSCLAGLAL